MQTSHSVQSSLHSLLLFQRRPKPCIGFTFLQLSWRCDRPWEARIHSVLILSPSPIGFDCPQHMHSNPYSTANKSLSSDTIQEKVCSRSSAQTLSVFGLDLFWSTLFQSLDVWHKRIDMPVAQAEMKTVMFCAALMAWIIIRMIWICVSAPFWHFIHRLFALTSGECVHTIIHITHLLAHCSSWPFVK